MQELMVIYYRQAPGELCMNYRYMVKGNNSSMIHRSLNRNIISNVYMPIR